MRIVLLIGALSICGTSASAAVKIPYFKSLTEKDVCGSASCQPHLGPRYTFFRNPVDYLGRPEDFLGRKYRNVYSTSPCTIKPQVDDIDVTAVARMNATAEEATISKLNGEVKSDIAAIMSKIVSSLSPDLKMTANALIDNTITNSSVRNLSLEYQRMKLKPEFWDEHAAACKARMGSKEMVIGGIAVVRVSGDWTRQRVADILNKLEGDASFATLVSGDAKKSYDADKKLALEGSFEPTAFVIATSWFRRKDIN